MGNKKYEVVANLKNTLEGLKIARDIMDDLIDNLYCAVDSLEQLHKEQLLDNESAK